MSNAFKVTSLIENTRGWLRSSLSKEQRDKLVEFQNLRFRKVQELAQRIWIGSNLKSLSIVNNTDKWGSHWYAQHYETHFAKLRRKKLNILEIGIGGYDDPKYGGGSLRAWRSYFPKSRIYGIDIYDKSLHDERRIKTFKGSQADEQFLERVAQTIGRIDIIIDDGSHENEHILATFKFLFPRLSENGIYVVEDVQTSYWQRFGGSRTDFNSLQTAMGFFKSLIDGINHSEFEDKTYSPNYYDKHIVAMHFYHNLVFIQKGLNDEKSNMIKRPNNVG